MRRASECAILAVAAIASAPTCAFAQQQQLGPRGYAYGPLNGGIKMRKGGSKKPAAKPKSNFGLTVATIFVALTSGLLASAGLVSGGTSDAMSVT